MIPRVGDLSSLRAATLCLINRERLSHHEHPLVESVALGHAAAAHSRDMVSRNYFEHVSPSGSTAAQRILRSGYARAAGFMRRRRRWVLAENLATAGGYLASPVCIVAMWMQSPAHRANILDPTLRASGVGVALGMPHSLAAGWRGSAGTYTQDFVGR
jgi:uncharacterized protein YkwD